MLVGYSYKGCKSVRSVPKRNATKKHIFSNGDNTCFYMHVSLILTYFNFLSYYRKRNDMGASNPEVSYHRKCPSSRVPVRLYLLIECPSYYAVKDDSKEVSFRFLEKGGWAFVNIFVVLACIFATVVQLWLNFPRVFYSGAHDAALRIVAGA